MSEFSTSYHLISANQQDAIDLLKRANLHGYIFPEKNGIVTFVIRQDRMAEFTRCEQLLLHNTKPLIYFINSEDHGWSYELYYNCDCVAEYSSRVNEEGLTEGFDYENPETLISRDDVNYYIYDGTFQMERVKELLENSMDFEKKLAVIQRSKSIVDTQNGLTEEVELSLTEEALPADEFVEAFGDFYNEWVSYYYLERIIDEENVLDYGSLGKFPLIVV